MIKERGLHYKSQEEIKAFQEARLCETLQYLATHSPFYKRMFAENRIDVSEVRTLEDFQQIPTTTKQDLQS